MSGAFYVGAVGLQTQQRALDTVANNIANINTGGFKRSEVRFADVVASRADPVVLPANFDAMAEQLAGVSLDVQFMLDEQGAIERTGEAMDLAIDGAGLIELMGPGGRTLLWRGGGLSIGEDGLLAAGNGMPLKAAIAIPRDATGLVIAADGTVTAKTGGTEDIVELGQIHLVRIADADALERLDGGLYRLSESQDIFDATPGDDGVGTLVQGSIERSNVALTDEMVRMMLVQRAYAANAQIVQAADQMMAIANGLRR